VNNPAYLPSTTQDRGSWYEVPVGPLPFLDRMSMVNVQGIGPLIDSWLECKLGQLPTDTLAKVKEAVRSVLEW